MLRDKIIEHTINEFEGGLSNRKSDRGGLTNYGITKPFYATMMGVPVSSIPDVDIKNMTKNTAINLYTKYWEICRCDDIPEVLRHIYFDVCINSGQGNAVKLLQRTIMSFGTSIYPDGRIGPATIRAAQEVGSSHSEEVIISRFVQKRIDFYKAIVDNDITQSVNLKGWTNRANWFLKNRII